MGINIQHSKKLLYREKIQKFEQGERTQSEQTAYQLYNGQIHIQCTKNVYIKRDNKTRIIAFEEFIIIINII